MLRAASSLSSSSLSSSSLSLLSSLLLLLLVLLLVLVLVLVRVVVAVVVVLVVVIVVIVVVVVVFVVVFVVVGTIIVVSVVVAVVVIVVIAVAAWSCCCCRCYLCTGYFLQTPQNCQMDVFCKPQKASNRRCFRHFSPSRNQKNTVNTNVVGSAPTQNHGIYEVLSLCEQKSRYLQCFVARA